MPTDQIYRANAIKQLGMPIGTARNRLVKEILFSLIRQLGLRHCYKCGDLIQKSSDLTIEHKENWLHHANAKELYFDLSNIAYSHKWCNKVDRPGKRGLKMRKDNGDGTVWCTSCKKYLSPDSFHKNKNRWNGLCAVCKSCKKAKP